MGKTNTKKMVQGAMIAAIFGVLAVFNTYTGSLFDIFICYVMVVPLVWYGYTYDMKSNAIVCVVSMFVIAMMGLPFFIISSISSCLAGMFIGECLKKKQRKEIVLLGTFVIMLFNNILIYEVFAGLLEMDLISELTLTYQEISQFIPRLTQTITLQTFLSFIPFILIIMSVMEMYVVVLMCQVMLMRLKVEFPGSFHIATMHLSRKCGYVVGGLMVGSYFLNYFVGIDSVYLTYVYTLCMFILGLQGLSFVCFYLIMKGKPKWMFLAFLVVFLPIASTIYIVLGILDIFSDLRRNILYNENNKG